jgi:hypothetical protein
MQKRIAIGMIFPLIVFAACQRRPSPAASATCDLGGGKTIKTNYSNPRMKGRKIYGDPRTVRPSLARRSSRAPPSSPETSLKKSGWPSVTLIASRKC